MPPCSLPSLVGPSVAASASQGSPSPHHPRTARTENNIDNIAVSRFCHLLRGLNTFAIAPSSQLTLNLHLPTMGRTTAAAAKSPLLKSPTSSSIASPSSRTSNNSQSNAEDEMNANDYPDSLAIGQIIYNSLDPLDPRKVSLDMFELYCHEMLMTDFVGRRAYLIKKLTVSSHDVRVSFIDVH